MILQLNKSSNIQTKTQDMHSSNVDKYVRCIAKDYEPLSSTVLTTDIMILSMSVTQTHEISPIRQASNAHSRCACSSHEHIVTPTHKIFPLLKTAQRG